jgi:hypothetical protein
LPISPAGIVCVVCAPSAFTPLKSREPIGFVSPLPRGSSGSVNVVGEPSVGPSPPRCAGPARARPGRRHPPGCGARRPRRARSSATALPSVRRGLGWANGSSTGERGRPAASYRAGCRIFARPGRKVPVTRCCCGPHGRPLTPSPGRSRTAAPIRRNGFAARPHRRPECMDSHAFRNHGNDRPCRASEYPRGPSA